MHSISDSLYAASPDEVLFHYTSLQGLVGIVTRRAIWASDIRYLNDSAEIRHTSDLILAQSQRRIDRCSPHAALLSQFQDWLLRGISPDHLLFGSSFRANGNLLSQWRGYSVPGKGVSLGLAPELLLQAAQRQGFRIGRCIYDPARQQQLIEQILDTLEARSAAHARKENGATDYAPLFRSVEVELLHIAALLKHPAFAEEEEWRLVASVMTDGSHPGLRFREGRSMLVPYVEFHLTEQVDQPLPLSQLFLGPTPNAPLSLQSLTLFLERQGIRPAGGIHFCEIPYRER